MKKPVIRQGSLEISRLFIDETAVGCPEAELIQDRLPVPAIVVQNSREVYQSILSHKDPVLAGKHTLYLTRNRGAFIKDCPGTRHYTCCGYKILHIGTYCTMDCSYCILQSYFHPPCLQYFVNHEDLFSELDALFEKREISRIGTGEFTDSLIWEPLSDLTETLVHRFSAQTAAVLELKTKTRSVNRLDGLPHNRKTIMAWSLNTERVIAQEERRTSSLSERLAAAAQCESWGYPLAFHFDPMVIYNGCEKEYKEVVKQIFSRVSPENIVWISIGSFRFIPSLKPLIQERFSRSKIVYGEFVSGLDGKMRYFKPLRIKLYEMMVSVIKEAAPEVLVYFCMEDDDVWKKTLGITPSQQGGLPEMLDKRAAMLCNLSDTNK
jgi:spore photoproduct lyase